MLKKWRIVSEVWVVDNNIVNSKIISQRELIDADDDDEDEEDEN